jgi:DNA-binding transcriptional LysR family regulator
MTVNQFAGVPPILVASDLAVTVVRRAISLSPYADQLVIQPVPVPLRSSALSLLWHKRLNAHPANEWLKSTLLEIAKDLPI